MKKFLVFLFFVLTAVTAFAVGENIPTSKSYVDSAVAQKQDKIPANNGAEQILMNTGTPGNVGTKDIYDSTGSYIEQTDALVTAEQFNTAVQNAIDSEFECVGWDQTHTHCWFVKIRGVTEQTVLPTGYTALEYLESTGTQYIDTGVIPNSNTGVIADFQYTDTRSGEQVVFGVVENNFLIDRISGIMYYAYKQGRSLNGAFQMDEQTARYTVALNWKNSGTASMNDTTKQLSSVIFSNSVSMYIFASNYIDHGAYIPMTGRIYNIKVSQNADMVRNFVPARRDRDGELGMYDLVSNTFFTNAGDGEFIAGPDANNIYLPSN